MAEYNESQINSNEIERISAEQQRIENEAKRQTKETEREAREAIRQSNESTRISKEAERQAEEVNRVTAENNRGIRLGELENELNDTIDIVRPLVSDLSSSISEELINENVTSFKAGTSNVNGIDLTNQMEQSLVDIAYIKGKTVEENSKLNSVKVVFDSGEKELYSLQDRFYDEYKDGKLHKRIRKLTNADFNVEEALCGSNAGWNIDGNTYGFYFQKCGSDCIDDTSVDCNLFRYNDELVSNDTPGVAISGEWGWIGFRVNKTTLGIVSSDGNVQKLQKAKEWFKRTYVEVYYLVNETITDESITILANPNEEINVVSSTPTTIKHTVQLNTKSQVEETQKQIVKSNKSIWQKFKELIDAEFEIGQIGYIKLPTILGGLLIQWGRTSIEFTNVQYKSVIVEYPTPFKNDIYFQTCNMFNECTEAYHTNTSIVYSGLDRGKICAYGINGNMNCNVLIYYVAIGK